MTSKYNENGQNKYYNQTYTTLDKVTHYNCDQYCSCRKFMNCSLKLSNMSCEPSEKLTNYSELTGRGYYSPKNWR